MNTQYTSFEDIRNSIIEYYSTKAEFKDFNFKASGISSLIDALAYTSQYLIQYANFGLNECFLDSAQLRSSVVSRAKGIGYFPYQYTSARAKIDLIVTDTNINITEGSLIPSGTTFIATDTVNTSFSFQSIENAYFTKNKDNYWHTEIDLVEGTYITEHFLQDEYYINKFILSNSQVDTNYMSVIVYPSSSSTSGSVYEKASSVSQFKKDALLFYLQESYTGNVELYFGDDVLSKKLDPYNYIEVKYLISSGSKANNIVSFVITNKVSGIDSSVCKINVLEKSNSGSDKESIDSIKMNAPKFFQKQNRNVTVSDYNNTIISNFGGWIDSIVSWGGEDNNPPQYGKVFISVKPKHSTYLTSSQINDIKEKILLENIVCIEPEFVDPVTIDIDLTTSINYFPYNTSLSKTQLANKISETVSNFFTQNITGFNSAFKFSKFVSLVSAIDSSIDSLLVDIVIKQTLIPSSGNSKTYQFYFFNEIEQGSLKIGPWNDTGSTTEYTIYDFNGKLYINDSSTTSIGTIDYKTGYIEINEYVFNTEQGLTIPVKVKPKYQNLSLQRNYIFQLDTLVVNLSVGE